MTENHHKITKSYDTPMTRDEMRALVTKALIKFQKGGKNIVNMSSWLKDNNIGNIQYNRWIRAMVDNMFKFTYGSWLPINQNLSVDQITDKIMVHWNKKLKKA